MFNTEQLDVLQAEAEQSQHSLPPKQLLAGVSAGTIVPSLDLLQFVAAHRAALSRIARVEALHTPTPRLDIWRRREIGGEYCTACEDEYPCPTVRALTEGEPSESES